MAYLIAKQYGKSGCIAITSEVDASLQAQARRLSKMVIHTGVQISLVYNDEDLAEYSPCELYEDHDAFFTEVLDLAEW